MPDATDLSCESSVLNGTPVDHNNSRDFSYTKDGIIYIISNYIISNKKDLCYTNIHYMLYDVLAPPKRRTVFLYNKNISLDLIFNIKSKQPSRMYEKKGFLGVGCRV